MGKYNQKSKSSMSNQRAHVLGDQGLPQQRLCSRILRPGVVVLFKSQHTLAFPAKLDSGKKDRIPPSQYVGLRRTRSSQVQHNAHWRHEPSTAMEVRRRAPQLYLQTLVPIQAQPSLRAPRVMLLKSVTATKAICNSVFSTQPGQTKVNDVLKTRFFHCLVM